MSTEICKHENVESNVIVMRLFADETAMTEGEINRFIAEIQIRCEDCKMPFGFKVPDIGLLEDRPTISPDAIEMRSPLFSPTEMELRQKVDTSCMLTNEDVGVDLNTSPFPVPLVESTEKGLFKDPETRDPNK